jgi:ADP-ribose pyrophosphatase YjhB (NUDIX family)
MNSNNQYELASDFQPLPGEANFPPPILIEVVGGAHIAPECVTIHGGRFVMTVWPEGLPRHDDNRTVRFPHGLIHFGETIEQCARRLVKDQQGFQVDTVRVLDIDSYVDEKKHWHIEPLILVTVSGEPQIPKAAEKIVYFGKDHLPDGAMWDEKSFAEMIAKHIDPIPNILS